MGAGFERSLRTALNTFVSLFARISSIRLSSACDISGFKLSRVLARKSGPYFCFTRDGRSFCIRCSHAKVIRFSIEAAHMPPVSHHGGLCHLRVGASCPR